MSAGLKHGSTMAAASRPPRPPRLVSLSMAATAFRRTAGGGGGLRRRRGRSGRRHSSRPLVKAAAPLRSAPADTRNGEGPISDRTRPSGRRARVQYPRPGVLAVSAAHHPPPADHTPPPRPHTRLWIPAQRSPPVPPLPPQEKDTNVGPDLPHQAAVQVPQATAARGGGGGGGRGGPLWAVSSGPRARRSAGTPRRPPARRRLPDSGPRAKRAGSAAATTRPPGRTPSAVPKGGGGQARGAGARRPARPSVTGRA